MFGPDRRVDDARPGDDASPDADEADAQRQQAVARRSFHIQKNLLRVTARGSAILAAVFISIVAANDWHDRMAGYTTLATRTARVLDEHALKVLQLNEALEQQVVDYLDGFREADVTRHEAEIHRHLRAMASRMPSVASIYVADARGTLQASSVIYPVPRFSLSNQRYFRGAMGNDPLEKVSPAFVGMVSRELLFNTTVKRLGDDDGSVDGIVSIALRPRYFASFYRDTAGTALPWRLLLGRTDGAVLAQYPPPDDAPAELRTMAQTGIQTGIRASAPTGAEAALRALAAGSTAGLLRPRSPFEAHGTLLAFRKVDGFPVYVSVSLPLAAIRAEWLRHMGLLSACLLLPCLLLWGVIAASLRRLARSERDWHELQAEIATRKAVEEAYRQSRKMESLGRLVGNVAHDFNNLLMVVSANTQLARFAGVATLEPQIAAIERAVQDGQNLTRRLLGVMRKQPLRVESVPLQDWLVVYEARLREVLGEAVTLSWQVADDCRVRVDPHEFALAMTNIAINAREAMPAGGTFAIEAAVRRPGTDDVPTLRGECVCVVLRDSGVGMARAVLTRAFEPLFSTKAEGRGMGLGLPQVFAFCEQAGGTARIDSAPGEGTTVFLYLPRDGTPLPRAAHTPRGRPLRHAARLATPAVGRAPSPPRSTTVALCILLVEDDPAVAAANEELLMTLGHSVRRASSADAALALFEHGAANAIDVVVSDIQMPGTLNGIDLAERLAQAWPRVPVLLVTGYTRELERARRANRPVFAKPFDITALDRALRQIGAGGARGHA